jgi:exodeoxyribonuclease V gamma subunit
VPDLAGRVAAQVARVQRAGRLPLGEPGRRSAQALAEGLLPMLARWQALQAQYAQHRPHRALSHCHDGLWLNDWLTGLRGGGQTGESDGDGDGDGAGGEGAAVWLELSPGRLCTDAKKGQPRGDRLIAAWVRMLAASACSVEVAGVIVGRDACITVRPWPAERARAALGELMQAWREGRQGSGAPLPLAPRTALALVQGVADVAGVYEGSDFGHRRGEADEACLARTFPDYTALTSDGRFEALAQRLFAPLAAWIETGVQVEVFDAAGAVVPDEASHG